MYRILLSLLLIAPLLPQSASAQTAASLPVPAAPSVAANAWLMVDFNSGAVLAEHNADMEVEPASLTKIMTSYVVYKEIAAGNLALSDMVTVSEKAWRTGGSKMFIEVGKQVSVEDLLKGLIVQSGNDAAVALAEHVAGDEATFATLMNRHAERLGMTGTFYVNATGLPAKGHVVTARDMAILAAALIRDFPDHYYLHSVKEFTYNNIRQFNRNKLLWRDSSVDGIKTGHTEAAGYCLVASAKREDMRLISIVLGAKNDKSRADANQTLLNYGFRFYNTSRLYAAGDSLGDAKVWKGETEQLPVGVTKDLYVTVPRRQFKELKVNLELRDPIVAPIEEGQELGQVVVTLKGETIISSPVVALRTMPEAGLVGRTLDGLKMWFK